MAMAAVKNPTRSMSAFKGFCQKKAKKIDDFLHDNPDHNSRDLQEVEKLNSALESQLERMETAWESMVGNLDDDDTFNALEKMVNEVSGEAEKTLAASKRAISDKVASIQPGTNGTGATQQPVNGTVKIKETLKPRELLSADMNLEEANLWFDAYQAHIGFNKTNMAKLEIKVRRAMLNA